ncbi:MAG: apolipoprotein N-acyltransferase [Candidatus Zixiibacteriota bacterium]
MSVRSKIGALILPPDIELRNRRFELLVWSFLLSLAYYPGWFGFLAWFSLARPFMIIAKLRGRQAFNAAYFFGFFFNAFSLYWVWLVTPPGALAAVMIVALYYAIVLLAFNRLYQWRPLAGIIGAPLLWVGMEYFRTLSQFAFPWSDLGYTQSYYLYILQIVSVVSVHGLSLLIVIVNVLVWQVWRHDQAAERRVTAAFASFAIVLGLLAYGWIELPPYPQQGRYGVALLQGSVPLDIKWELENEGYSVKLYDSLAQTVADSSIKLQVWPESAAPCYLSIDQYCRRMVGETARKTRALHLVGGLRKDVVGKVQHHYNSCFLFEPSGRMGAHYDKMKLVPFSETVPYQDNMPFLKRDILTKYLTLIDRYDIQWWSDFYPGDSIHLFELPDVTFGVLICFESTFPEFARQMVRDGAGFLVGITNDTWFGSSVGIHMHSRIFLTRAVENRCWMARAANTGLTYIVDPYGRIREQLPHNAVAALKGKVGLLDQYTFFTRHGDLAGRFSFLVLVSVLTILPAIWLIRKFLLRR